MQQPPMQQPPPPPPPSRDLHAGAMVPVAPPEQHDAFNDMKRWRSIVQNMAMQGVDQDQIDDAKEKLAAAETKYYAMLGQSTIAAVGAVAAVAFS